MGIVKGFLDKFRKGLKKTSSVVFAPIRKIAEVQARRASSVGLYERRG